MVGAGTAASCQSWHFKACCYGPAFDWKTAWKMDPTAPKDPVRLPFKMNSNAFAAWGLDCVSFEPRRCFGFGQPRELLPVAPRVHARPNAAAAVGGQPTLSGHTGQRFARHHRIL